MLCCWAVSTPTGPPPGGARGTQIGAGPPARWAQTPAPATSISAMTTPAFMASPDGDRIARRAGRPLEPQRRKHVGELVDAVARQVFGRQVFVQVDAVL